MTVSEHDRYQEQINEIQPSFIVLFCAFFTVKKINVSVIFTCVRKWSRFQHFRLANTEAEIVVRSQEIGNNSV